MENNAFESIIAANFNRADEILCAEANEIRWLFKQIAQTEFPEHYGNSK